MKLAALGMAVAAGVLARCGGDHGKKEARKAAALSSRLIPYRSISASARLACARYSLPRPDRAAHRLLGIAVFRVTTSPRALCAES